MDLPRALPEFASLGEIARLLDRPIHQVEYVRQIKPSLTAGGRHLYGKAATERIAAELHQIDERRALRQEVRHA
jgi:hypothetical protein